MDDIISGIVRLKQRGERMALASLVWSSGSIPMSDRAKMIVTEAGDIVGTIGGRTVLESGENQLLRYTMTEQQAGESGLNCGGTVRIYTQLIDPAESNDLYDEVLEARKMRKGGVLVTLLRRRFDPAGGQVWIGMDGMRSGSLGTREADREIEQSVPEVIKRERGQVLGLKMDRPVFVGQAFGEDPEVFMEPFLPEPVLYVFGGGHVGGQIVALAKNVGFQVVLVDDRPAFANAQRHPNADQCVVAEMEKIWSDLPIDDQSYIIAATRGHQHDEIVVEQAIKTPARYVGMLGSERKKLILWKRIADRGGLKERLDEVFAPIGVNIGADTPEEIAVSVVAELIEVRRGPQREWKTKKDRVNEQI